MQFGHLQEAGGMITKIDWTNLQLSDFEKEDTFPINYKIAFTGFYSDVSFSMQIYTHCIMQDVLQHDATLTFTRHCFSLSSSWKTIQLRNQLLGGHRDNLLQWPAMVLGLYNS